MAKPEQTEKATPQAQIRSATAWQLAKSPDLTGAIISLVAVVVIHAVLMRAMGGWGWTMQETLQHINAHEDLTIFSVCPLFLQALGAI